MCEELDEIRGLATDLQCESSANDSRQSTYSRIIELVDIVDQVV